MPNANLVLGRPVTLRGMAVETTTVHLVRHGEVFNPDHVLYERLDGFGLSQTGLAMADRLATFFTSQDNPPVTQLLTSPLLRAQQTAQPIAKALALEPQTEPRLIEAQNHFAGQVINSRQLLKPKNLVKLYNPMRPSWGEPYILIAQRMTQVMAQVRQAAKGQAAVMVSHQSPIWRARLLAEGRSLWRFPRGRVCSLASVTSLVFQDDRLIEVAYREPAADLLPADLR